LGILIPPSLILMIYGIIAQESIARLFAASLIPGILLTVLYIVVVLAMVRLRPELAPRSVVHGGGARELASAVLRVWHVAVLFVVALGGIYAGLFTPTEAAAVG